MDGMIYSEQHFIDDENRRIIRWTQVIAPELVAEFIGEPAVKFFGTWNFELRSISGVVAGHHPAQFTIDAKSLEEAFSKFDAIRDAIQTKVNEDRRRIELSPTRPVPPLAVANAMYDR